MAQITPKNITQQEILWLLECLVVLRDLFHKLDEKKMKDLGIGKMKQVPIKKYKERIDMIYTELDKK